MGSSYKRGVRRCGEGAGVVFAVLAEIQPILLKLFGYF